MNEIRRYEDYVIKFLSFKLNYYTTFAILEYILMNGVVFNNEFHSHEDRSAIKDKIKKVNKIAFQLLGNLIEDNNYVNFNHIEVAFACVTFAREVLKFKHVFPVDLEKIYDLKMGNFAKCYQYIAEYVKLNLFILLLIITIITIENFNLMI